MPGGRRAVNRVFDEIERERRDGRMPCGPERVAMQTRERSRVGLRQEDAVDEAGLATGLERVRLGLVIVYLYGTDSERTAVDIVTNAESLADADDTVIHQSGPSTSTIGPAMRT